MNTSLLPNNDREVSEIDKILQICFPSVNESCKGLSDYYLEFDGAVVPLRHPFMAFCLGLVSLTTVVGNLLVIYAVCSRVYLHSSTNYLIVSLAAADVIVGLLVMPINIFYETANHVWLFGFLVCDIWHSVDILASTASIWNLCVISLDRYLALKNPFTYSSVMSTRRTFLLIATVWTCASLLSFPSIAWWRLESPDLYVDQWSCSFVDDLSYLFFSSLLSFYIPMVVMMFAYWKIYVIATNTEKAYKTGQKRTSGIRGIGGRGSPAFKNSGSLQLRIHRGRATAAPSPAIKFSTCELNQEWTAEPSSGSRMASQAQGQVTRNGNGINWQCHAKTRSSNSPAATDRVSTLRSSSSSIGSSAATVNNNNSSLKDKDCQGNPQIQLEPISGGKQAPITRSISFLRSQLTNGTGSGTGSTESSGMPESPCQKFPLIIRELSSSAARKFPTRLSVGRRLTRFAREKKAAKTLAIVIGCFILCWLPFFIVNVLIGVCKTCVRNPTTVFTAVTWLGYCNSMLNPFIYPFFNVEFRRAFLNILCCGYSSAQMRRERLLTVRGLKGGVSFYSNSPLANSRSSRLMVASISDPELESDSAREVFYNP